MAHTTSQLVSIYRMAQVLRVSAEWLAAEARAGRLPHVNASGRLLFDPDAVKSALTARAAHSGESIAIRPTDALGTPLLSLDEMAAEIDAEPGWLVAQVEAGLIPAVRLNDGLWFRRDIVRLVVATCTEKILTRSETHADKPLRAVRCCDEADERT